MKRNLFVSLCVISLSGTVYADCPDELDIEMMSECITIEGSGANYQDWLANFNNSASSESTASTISPITRTDVRTIQPAAGGSYQEKASYTSQH